MKQTLDSAKNTRADAVAAPPTLVQVGVRVAKNYLAPYKLHLAFAAVAAVVVATTTSGSTWLVGHGQSTSSATHTPPAALINIPLAIVAPRRICCAPGR